MIKSSFCFLFALQRYDVSFNLQGKVRKILEK